MSALCRTGLVTLIALLGPLDGRPVAAQDPRALTFTNVTVVDVERGVLLPNHTVIVSGTRITAVGPAASVRAPAGATVVDASGKYLAPGLWDMHVHAAFPGIDRVFLPLLVANGVTGVREMWGLMPVVDSLRRQVGRVAFTGPRIVAAGHILDGLPVIWPGSVGVGTADAARRAVDSLVSAGADFIKVYSRLSPEAYRAAAAAAKARGVPFAGHVPTLVSVAEASDLGQRTVEHLTGLLGACSTEDDRLRTAVAAAVASPKGWDSAGVVQRMAGRTVASRFDAGRCRALAARLVRNGTWMVPTIAVLHSVSHLDDSTLAKDPRLKYISRQFSARWDPRQDFRFRTMTQEDWTARRAAYRRQLEIVTLLHRAGVSFLAGTDLSNPYIFPGFSLHDELASFVAAGMTPAEALRTATVNPARFLGATDSLGTVAVGKLADLVLLEGDPLADIEQVRRIAGVVANGWWYDAAARARLLAEAERVAGGPPGGL